MSEYFPLLAGAAKLGLQLTFIIVALVTMFEVFRYATIFRRAGRALDPLMAGLGLSATSIIPLFTGIFLGISYGAGITIRVMEEKKIPPRELFLLGLFLCTCHGVIEDTLIFVLLGANGWILLCIRLSMAVTITALLAHFWRCRKNSSSFWKSGFTPKKME